MCTVALLAPEGANGWPDFSWKSHGRVDAHKELVDHAIGRNVVFGVRSGVNCYDAVRPFSVPHDIPVCALALEVGCSAHGKLAPPHRLRLSEFRCMGPLRKLYVYAYIKQRSKERVQAGRGGGPTSTRAVLAGLPKDTPGRGISCPLNARLALQNIEMWPIFVHRSGFVLSLATLVFILSPPPRNFPVYQCEGQETAHLSFAGPQAGEASVRDATLRILDGALVLVYTSAILSLVALLHGCDAHRCKGGVFSGLLLSTTLSHLVCLAFLVAPAILEKCEPSTAPAAEVLNVLYWVYVCICFGFKGESKAESEQSGTAPLLLLF